MSAVLADTFYFFAQLNPRDAAHARVVAYAEDHDPEIVTTSWILTELGNGLSRTSQRILFREFVEALRDDPATVIVPASEDLFDRGLGLYDTRPDKEWSLTDCISFVVMQQMGITEALTGDHHFEQAGFVALLK